MSPLLPFINGVSTAVKKLIVGRRGSYRVSSFKSLVLASSFYENKLFLIDDSTNSEDALPSPYLRNIVSNLGEAADLSFNNSNGTREVAGKSLLFISNYQSRGGREHERIESLLTKHGLRFNSENGDNKVDLGQYNISNILYDLFVTNSDASLSFYFFWWSENCTGSKHSIHSVCSMIQLLIAGKMNYIATDLIKRIVRSNRGGDEWLSFLISVFYENRLNKRVLMTAYSMLVDCYIREEILDVAKLTIKMKELGIMPSLGVCNSMLRALLGSGQMELAWDFLEEMHSKGLSCNASILSLFIQTYCADGNVKTGLKLLMEMNNYGVEPDVVAYTIVIDSLCKKGFLREATCILFKMLSKGISLDSVIVSSLFDGYCKVEKLENVVAILKIFQVSHNIYTFNSLLSRLCNDSNMAVAVNIFEEMLNLGLHPDCFCYTNMIGGYLRIGEMDKAFSFLAKMLKVGMKVSVAAYTMLIDCYGKSGDVDEAERLFDKMLGDGLKPDVVAYNSLMSGYGKRGQIHKAFELLDMMRNVGVYPDNVTYNIIVHSLVSRGFVNEAKGIVDELIRRGFSPDVVTLTSIIGGYSNKGNFEEAFLVWFYMNENGMKPDVVTCNALLNGYCKAKRMDKANAFYEKMLNIGLVPDLILYNTLVHGFCSVGGVDDALRLVSKMVENGIAPNDVTRRALVLGYEKRHSKNPSEAATFKLEEIMQNHGLFSGIE